MNNNEVDTDIDNYTITELKEMFDITNRRITKEEIKEKINKYIENTQSENNPELSTFLRKSEKKLLDNVGITETEAFNVPIERGNKNPTLRNVTNKIISIDSRFRQDSVPALGNYEDYSDIPPPIYEGTWSTTNYTISLNDHLTNVLKLKLYTVHIPFSWYNIDSNYGNNCFEVITPTATYVITITPGYYTSANLSTAINDEFNTKVNSVDPDTFTLTSSYNAINGKFTIASDAGAIADATIQFYDYTKTNVTTPICSSCKGTTKINNTLGWLLGFRNVSYVLTPDSSITGEAVTDLYGTKYLILIIDDFNANRVNRNFITSQDKESTLSLPNYFSTSISTFNSNGQIIEQSPECLPDTDDYNGIVENDVNVPFYTQSFPRKMTQNQQYSINEILKSRQNVENIKLTSPSIDNFFAIIPFDTDNLSFGDTITERVIVDNVNERIYFGPVDIERLKITLMDDTGNILNLNGAEWTFTLISEELYQY